MWRRSISLQSPGAEHVISVPVSFSTQRKAGMSSLEPSRIPAWLAPVCDERSVSHSTSWCVPAASQRAISGAWPSRSARWSTGNARPSISTKTMPGLSVRTCLPERRAIRSITRSEYVSSLLTPRAIWNTSVAAAAAKAPASAQPNESTVTESLTRPAAVQRTAASRNRTSRNPLRTVNGSRIRAIDRNDQRVEDADDRNDAESAEHAVDAKPRQHNGRSQEARGREGPADQQAAEPSSRPPDDPVPDLCPTPGSPSCGASSRSRRARLLSARSRRSASAFRCWSSLSSVVSSVFWSRRRSRRATSPSYDSSVLTNVPPARGSNVWTWIALMPKRRARPGDPPR